MLNFLTCISTTFSKQAVKGSGETVRMRMGRSRGHGGTDPPPPLKNHNIIGVPSNTGLDPPRLGGKFTSGIYRYFPAWQIRLKWQILANNGKYNFFARKICQI